MSILEHKEVWRSYVAENRWQYQRPSLSHRERLCTEMRSRTLPCTKIATVCTIISR
jgi:hypothetical protein